MNKYLQVAVDAAFAQVLNIAPWLKEEIRREGRRKYLPLLCCRPFLSPAERERSAGVSDGSANAFLPKHATLYCTWGLPPPQKVQSEGFPPKRPCSVLGAAFGSSRERREGNERTNASFALSSQQHCRILPPALDVTYYSNWCGDLKELRRVLPPPSSPFVWGSLAAPRHLQNLQHSFNSPSPSLNTTSSAFFLPPKF